jgi:hypothetical protein
MPAWIRFRAAGVHLVELAVLVDLALGRCRGFGAEEALPALPAPRHLTESDPALYRWQLVVHAVDGGGEGAACHQKLCTGVVDDERPLGRSQAIVERHRHDAGFRAAIVEEQELQTVVAQKGRAVSELKPGRDQGVGDTIGAGIGFRVAQALVAEHRELAVGLDASPVLEIVMQSHADASRHASYTRGPLEWSASREEEPWPACSERSARTGTWCATWRKRSASGSRPWASARGS